MESEKRSIDWRDRERENVLWVVDIERLVVISNTFGSIVIIIEWISINSDWLSFTTNRCSTLYESNYE